MERSQKERHRLPLATTPSARGPLCRPDGALVAKALGDIRGLAARLEVNDLYARAVAHIEDRTFPTALELGSAVLDRDPDHSLARSLVAVCQAYLGRSEESRRNALRAEREAPGELIVVFRAGDALEELGDDAAARRRFLRCRELDSGYFKAECRLAGIALRGHDNAAATEHSDRLIALNPACPCAYTRRALCQLEARRPRPGRAALEDTVRTGLGLNPFQRNLHAIAEVLWPKEARRIHKRIDAHAYTTNDRLDLRRLRARLRDGDLADAYAIAGGLDTPADLRALACDLRALLAVRLAGATEEPRRREALLGEAEAHVAEAEKVEPDYWLTKLAVGKLRRAGGR